MLINPDGQAVNTVREYRLVLSGPDGSSLKGAFDGTEVFSVKLWAGDDQAPVWTSASAVAWDGEVVGNPADLDSPVLLLTVTAPAIPGLLEGLYRFQIRINPGVDDVEIFAGTIRFLSAPGAAAPLPVYCTAEDLRGHASWIDEVLDSSEDETGFAEQRNLSRRDIDRVIMGRAESILRDQMRRHNPIQRVEPIVPQAGWDAGPTYGPSTIPDTTLRDQLVLYRGYLDSDKLIRDADLRQAAGQIALWHILKHQIGSVPDGTPYQKLGREFLAAGRRLLLTWKARIDVDGDGVTDIEIPAY